MNRSPDSRGRIGDGYRCDPETIALAKDEIATRLAGLARQMERAE